MLILLLLAAIAGGIAAIYLLSSYGPWVAVLMSPVGGLLLVLIAAAMIVIRDLTKSASGEKEVQQALESEHPRHLKAAHRRLRLRDKLLSPFQ